MQLPNPRTFKNAAFNYLAEVGKALSSARRLEIIELLAQAPRTVEVLAGEIEQSVANTSQHLQVLKRAQLVTAERDGLHKVYALSGVDVVALLLQLQAVAGRHLAALDNLTRAYFAARDGLEAIDQDTLMARLNDGEVVLIDVRPEHEFAEGHLPGALCMPLAELEARLNELPSDATIVAYCRGPFCTFSADAARLLRARGYDARRSDVTVSNLQLQRSAV